jgi:acylglycerol lipase
LGTLATERTLAPEGTVASADGTLIAYRAWPVAGASVTFAVVHGLGEHAGRYAEFARGMARHGMATVAADLRGHGKSPGQRGHIDSWSQWTEDAAALVQHVEGSTEGEVIPLGHSFGGAVMLSTVLAGKLPRSRRFVISSPALRVRLPVPGWKVTLGKVASKVAPRLALDNEVDPGAVSRVPEVVEAYRTDPLVHSKISSRTYTEWLAAARDILDRAGEYRIPFLIVAGTDDPLIDPEGSRELNRRSPKMSRLEMFDGRYHEPFNDVGSDEVFASIARWVTGS